VLTYCHILGHPKVDVWDEAGDNVIEHVAGVDDFETAVATYRAACLRWPKAKITLGQGARVVVRNWRNGNKSPARAGLKD